MSTTKRGDEVVSAGGAPALYVGEARGLVWLCYEPAGFAAMCQAFDRWAAR